MSKPNNFYNKLIFGKYKFLQLIGRGSFGYVLKGINIATGENVAIKVEDYKKTESILEGEAFFLFFLKGYGIPEVKSYGIFGKYKVLVQTLLGDSLEIIFIKMRYNLSIKDICMVAIQLLDRLEFIHSKYIIHRDIKPDNIMIDYETKRIIYLIDFGLAKKYRSSRTGKHIKFTIPKRLTGTARYASVNALRGTEQSRRDDLESAGYVFVYLAQKGDLPWQGLNIEDKLERYKKIYLIKRDIKPNILCKGLPKEFAEYIKYVKGLPFEDEPNYNYLKGLFTDVLTQKMLKNDLHFSWLENKEIKKDIKINNLDNKQGTKKSSLKRKTCPQARLYKNIQTSKEKEKNLKKVSENKILSEIEEKQEQREKDILLKRKKNKNKLDNSDIDCATQKANYDLSLNIEDIDNDELEKNEKDGKDGKINKNENLNFNIEENIKIGKKKEKNKINEEQKDNKNNKDNINNNTLKNRPIIFNFENGSFNSATLVKCLSHRNIKTNFINMDKLINERNQRTSIKSPKITEEYIKSNLISKKNIEKTINEEKNRKKENLISNIKSPQKIGNNKNKIIKIKYDHKKIENLYNKEIINKSTDNINKIKNIKLNDYISPVKYIKEKENNKPLIRLNKKNIDNNNISNINKVSRNLKRINVNQINNINNNKINNSNNIIQSNYSKINIISNRRTNRTNIDERRNIKNNMEKNMKKPIINHLIIRNSSYKNYNKLNESFPSKINNTINSNSPNKINRNIIENKSLENNYHRKRKIFQKFNNSKSNSKRKKNNEQKNKINNISKNQEYFDTFYNNYEMNNPNINYDNTNKNKIININKNEKIIEKPILKKILVNQNEMRKYNNININSNINNKKKIILPMNNYFNAMNQNNYNYNNLNNSNNNIYNNSYINTTKNNFNFNIINNNSPINHESKRTIYNKKYNRNLGKNNNNNINISFTKNNLYQPKNINL